mmetsp:Transcript_28418/g.65920  ORF Transcript_28418/g.65920 Transcript_28418/m.65920 type:complete len:302 (-) Transcript_28418:181-1086(-)
MESTATPAYFTKSWMNSFRAKKAAWQRICPAYNAPISISGGGGSSSSVTSVSPCSPPAALTNLAQSRCACLTASNNGVLPNLSIGDTKQRGSCSNKCTACRLPATQDMCSAVLPSWSAAFGSAPNSSNARKNHKDSGSAAAAHKTLAQAWRVEFEFSVEASVRRELWSPAMCKYAPLSCSTRAASNFLALHAAKSGVCPCSSVPFGSAPLSSNNRMMSVRPLMAAACSGVQPWRFEVMAADAPAAISCFMAPMSPLAAAVQSSALVLSFSWAIRSWIVATIVLYASQPPVFGLKVLRCSVA